MVVLGGDFLVSFLTRGLYGNVEVLRVGLKKKKFTQLFTLTEIKFVS